MEIAFCSRNEKYKFCTLDCKSGGGWGLLPQILQPLPIMVPRSRSPPIEKSSPQSLWSCLFPPGSICPRRGGSYPCGTLSLIHEMQSRLFLFSVALGKTCHSSQVHSCQDSLTMDVLFLFHLFLSLLLFFIDARWSRSGSGFCQDAGAECGAIAEHSREADWIFGIDASFGLEGFIQVHNFR